MTSTDGLASYCSPRARSATIRAQPPCKCLACHFGSGPPAFLAADLSVITWFNMARQSVLSRKRGPPPTGKGELIGVRLQPRALSALDAWIRKTGGTISRPEAIRRLVELALTGTLSMPRTSPKVALKAAELAAQQIDQLSDPTATDEQRQTRKRRLLKGPQEFRHMRSDLPKRKR
jgi:hypothetical protein